MWEAHYDYGPIPFKFFHYWFELDGFDKLVEQTWLEANARLHKESLNNRKSIHKAELADLDGVIDKGEGSDADSHRRREVVRLIQEVEKNDDLEREVSNEEIKRAVWDCGIDKAPGPDGFTFGYYRRYWDIIGNDVVDAVKWFFLHGEIPKRGNSSFITLILKVPNANMVKDFRPISLIGSLYKVIAKVMANRLVTVLDDIVDEIQFAFVTDRQILDGTDLAKITKKQSKPNKIEHEIEKIAQNPDSKTFSVLKLQSKKSNMDSSFTLGSNEEVDTVKILQSCNGLLQCSDDFGSSKFTIYEMMTGYFVWTVKYRVHTDDFKTPLPEDLISKTLHEIYDCGSNQPDDNHDDNNDDDDDDDDELLQQFQAEHNEEKVRCRVLICEIEALGERGVAVNSLESLKQTHARETAKLAALTYSIAESLAGIHEKERHVAKIDLND
nr:RNA-directed DNA polymerase, eukaryota, reverse transcriptase zinc-binding domain protein [Tanacetum cinerariifolium]